jgi:antitoxin component HigA of HigAB toxin-antitoxin module
MYEDEVYPIDIPDPVDAIKFRIEQQSLNYVEMVTGKLHRRVDDYRQ